MPAPQISESATRPTTTTAAPTPADLFRGFAKVGLSGFGGVLPWARRMLVDTERWLTAEEFNVLLGLCQFLPGPNVVNLAVAVGVRCSGWRGAVSGALGLMLGPFLIALVLGLLYARYGELPAVQSMLHGITLVGAGLIIATGIRMGLNVKNRKIYLPFSGAAFVGLVLLHWPLPLVMIGGAVLTVSLSWWRLSQEANACQS
jgi:chromate transporter